jgi:choline dehydrogenase-like flavoprotein
MSERFDAIVVGAGAAGSLLASRLAEAGRRVLMLEAGPERSLQDLSSSLLWARRLKWGGAPVIETGTHPIGHNFNVGWGTGGAALHHYAVWPRLHPEDFTLASRHGRALDWPIDYADLRPWYDLIQQEVGISGDHEQESWRPEGEPYNQPAVPVFAHGSVIARGFAASGMRTAPLPLAIRTRGDATRAGCIWDGWCDAGCPIGALANPLVTYLPRALAAGASLRNRAMVSEILLDASGTRATGVAWHDADGGAHVAESDVVIVAASTVQNARLLLASRGRSPRGLGNGSDQLGRYVTIHLACPVYGLWDEETQCHMGATGGQLLNQDGYAKVREGGPFGSYQWMIAQAMKPNDLLGVAMSRVDLHGPALQDFMQRAARGFAMMTGVVEDQAQADNRVTLHDNSDQWGMPLAQVAHSCAEESLALWQFARDQGIDILRAGGASEAWAGGIGPMHNMGGTIMGNDPAASVTNSFGQCHEVPNVLVAGASLFPSSGAVNPTFTIHALAARSAAHLLGNWTDIAG